MFYIQSMQYPFKYLFKYLFKYPFKSPKMYLAWKFHMSQADLKCLLVKSASPNIGDPYILARK